MGEPRIISVLIPAVGGQGGGVLAEWIVEAALADGHAVQSTSIPGVAQRTGSTSYYIELFDDPAGAGPEPPIFSLYPVPGALDVLLAPEFLEVGRAIELGFPSPARTTIIASSHRLYAIHEKMAIGRGIYPIDDLEAAARAFSQTAIVFDALALAREHGTEANAVLLGALAASGVLPVSEAAYRKAIDVKGVQVAANLKGFEVGLGRARAVMTARSNGHATAAAPVATPPPEFADEVAALPESLRETVSTALARLIDYQDAPHARRYLDRVRPFVARDPELARLVARYLAVWMTYEDAIRVAQLKTRWTRFERIRRDAGDPGAEIVVTDYVKPDLDEIYGILPHRLVAPFARWAERRWPQGRPTLGQHVRTTTVMGYLRLWLLARCRWLRGSSYRAHCEGARMERWLGLVERCTARDLELAREVAQAARLVKGYGQVRRRLETTFDDLLAHVSRAADLAAAGDGDFEIARALSRRCRALVLTGPDGEAQASRVGAEVVARLEARDRAGALAALGELAASIPNRDRDRPF